MSPQDWPDVIAIAAAAPIMSVLTSTRDIVIVAAGVLLIMVLMALFIFTVVLGLVTRTLLSAIQTMLKEEVTPLLGSARQTVQKVQGTTTFISETAVSPIIRVYSVAAGARRAVGVLSGIASRRSRHS